MRISGVNTYLVRPRWGFVEIQTDEGIVGWGEAVLEGHASTVAACVEEMSDYLIGADPMKIEDIWTVLYRAGFYRGGGVLMSAIAGIDQALWDIKGKHFQTPVYELMGGSCRDRMRVYSWVGGDRPTDVGAAAKERMDAGFTAVKMNATEELQMIDSYEKIDQVLERVGAIRDACGKYFGIEMCIRDSLRYDDSYGIHYHSPLSGNGSGEASQHICGSDLPKSGFSDRGTDYETVLRQHTQRPD